MKKIIDGAVNPKVCPNPWMGNAFTVSFVTALMRMEGFTSPEKIEKWRFCRNLTADYKCCGGCHNGRDGNVNWMGRYHREVENIYTIVVGMSLIHVDLLFGREYGRFDICNYQPSSNKLLAEFDDYIKFTMGFAGYTYERYVKNADKTAVFEAIKRSVDSDRPVLINFGNYYDWCPVVGYDDETGRVYGYDNVEWSVGRQPAAEGREDGMFYLSGWYESMAEAVVITGKTVKSVNYDDVFRRMIRILEVMFEKGDFKRSAEYLRDDSHFENYGDGEYRELAKHIQMFTCLPVTECSLLVWCFGKLSGDEAFRDKWPYLTRITAHYGSICDISWLPWNMTGPHGNPGGDVIKTFAVSPIARRTVADIIDIIRGNNEGVLNCLREMMGLTK